MRRSQNVRNKYKFKNFYQTFFFTYKYLILFAVISLLIGLITGIFTAARYSGDLELKNLTDTNLVNFLKSSSNGFSLFFPYLLNFAVMSIIIIVINFKPFLQVVSYLVLIFSGYIFGFNVTVIIVLYGFAGILNCFFIIIPFDILLNLVLVLLTAIAIKKNLVIKKYGCVYEKKYFFINTKKAYLFLIILGILIILIKCLFMPIIKITIIVN